MATYADDVTFTVRCTMRARWVPHFLGMLEWMRRLGSIGSSREVTFYSDGDGDFRPKFLVEGVDLPEPAQPRDNKNGAAFFDAG